MAKMEALRLEMTKVIFALTMSLTVWVCTSVAERGLRVGGERKSERGEQFPIFERGGGRERENDSHFQFTF